MYTIINFALAAKLIIWEGEILFGAKKKKRIQCCGQLGCYNNHTILFLYLSLLTNLRNN